MPHRDRLKVEVRPLASLRADPRNPRQHPSRQVEQVARSITEFGWTVPILVDGEGVVIGGNARLAAAKRLARETVPVKLSNACAFWPPEQFEDGG